jgi:GDPmannose 4,6-dehydratase
MGLQEKLYLGNLNSKRDWGHAKDYVRGMWQIMQQDNPQDYVLATGTTTSIRDFCKMTFAELGIDIEFVGEGVNEKGIDGIRDEIKKIAEKFSGIKNTADTDISSDYLYLR